MSSSVGVRGQVASSRCCFMVPGHEVGDVVLGVADTPDAVGDADVAHEGHEDRR